MCNWKFITGKMFIIVQLLIFFLFLFNRQDIFAQQKTLTVETPTLSAGAEYSQFLEKLKLLGNDKALEFNGVISQLQKPIILLLLQPMRGLILM